MQVINNQCVAFGFLVHVCVSCSFFFPCIWIFYLDSLCCMRGLFSYIICLLLYHLYLIPQLSRFMYFFFTWYFFFFFFFFNFLTWTRKIYLHTQRTKTVKPSTSLTTQYWWGGGVSSKCILISRVRFHIVKRKNVKITTNFTIK